MLDKEISLHLFRIVQELVHNIIKHAHAGKALVLLNLTSHGIDISVEDNGKGMQEDVVPGIGLSNIRQRIHALNGSLTIQSRPGMQVHITIPV